MDKNIYIILFLFIFYELYELSKLFKQIIHIQK